MNVNVEFPQSFEPALRQSAAAAGKDIAVFIREVVTEKIVPKPEPVRQGRMSHDEFKYQLDEWIKLHPAVTHVVDVSRESIYEGCGE